MEHFARAGASGGDIFNQKKTGGLRIQKGQR